MPEFDGTMTDAEIIAIADATTKDAIKKVGNITSFKSTLTLTNPYTKDTFLAGAVTEKVKVDSWVLSQVAANILEPTEETAEDEGPAKPVVKKGKK